MRRLPLLALLLATTPLLAHDFWLEPSTFRPNLGKRVEVALRVGEHFAGDPLPRSNQRIEGFFAQSGTRRIEIDGSDGDEPAGRFVVPFEAPLVVVYDSNTASVTLPAERFEKYLREEGLETIVEQRRTRGESSKEGREIYSRCAKALIVTQMADGGLRMAEGSAIRHPPSAISADRPVGLRLELVAETIGDRTTVQLFFDKKPLANALAVAMSKGDARNPQRVRTDKDGRATFDTAGGIWLIKAVHMIRAPRSARADWESLWASLTFQR